VTDAGRAALAAARPSVEAAPQQLLSPLTADERAQFLTDLIACADSFDGSRKDHP
jgi:DNA-binding MarR family transcriptional regulator